jgi:hypothetical protein
MTAPAAKSGRKEPMHPLLFVNWSSVNRMFRGLMWLCAIALATVIVVHLIPASAPAHHSMRVLR